MSKFTSRLNKVEENLHPKEKRITSMKVMGWNVPTGTEYFENEKDENWYQEWRITTIEEEYKTKGLVAPMSALCIDEIDVKTHIEEFRKYKESSDGFKGWTPMRIMMFCRSFFELDNEAKEIGEQKNN